MTATSGWGALGSVPVSPLAECPVCGARFIDDATGRIECERLLAAGFGRAGRSRYRDEPVCIACAQREAAGFFEFRDQEIDEDDIGV